MLPATALCHVAAPPTKRHAALLLQCGDVKAGRISVQMVERYLDKNVLVFNRDLLRDMFAEADFRKEGSLDVRALKASLSGEL